MEFSELIIEKIVSKMEEENMPLEIQKDYLKKLAILFDEKYNQIEELYINLVLNVFISGTGLGMLLFSDNETLSIIIILLGIIGPIIKKLTTKNINDYLDEYKKLEEYRENLEYDNFKEEKILSKKY